MDTVTKLQELQKKYDELRRKEAAARAQKEFAMKQIKELTGKDSVEEAQVVLNEWIEKKTELEARLATMIDKIETGLANVEQN